jgi:peroxiredoxin
VTVEAAATPPDMEGAMIPELVPGSRFPDVELPDHSGHQRRLSELAGGDPLMLNFYRGWW